MTDLSIKQEAGKIVCDFESAKAYLKAQLNDYQGLVFTEDAKKDAKAAVADLRKQKKAFQEDVSKVKTEYMKPFNEFMGQANELITMFDEPINFINGQVMEFEEKRRQEKVQTIMGLYNDIMTDGIDEYAPLDAIYDKKWENATTSVKSIQTALSDIKARTIEAVETIKSMGTDEGTEDIALTMYADSQNITDSIAYITRHEAEKARILEAEKARVKAEEEARIRAEERARIEAEMRAEAEKAKAVEIAREEVIETFIPEDTGEEAVECHYDMKVTPSQQEKIEMFLDSIGVEYEKQSEADLPF